MVEYTIHQKEHVNALHKQDGMGSAVQPWKNVSKDSFGIPSPFHVNAYMIIIGKRTNV